MLVATMLWIGRIPFAPGTFGSLAALPVGWAIASWGGGAALAAASATAFIAGTIAASRIVGRRGDADPGFIVVDEVAGQLLALALVPQEWWAWAIAFAAFRATDVLKPFPAGWCDRNMGGGIGVMADDMVAGLQAGIATWVLLALVPVGEALRAIGS
ncbi:MAG: phosphatidylglycerophosphatase A [Alphaproteobacteria bacterium]